jgi:phosphatidate cytidylyltransferase
MLHLRLIFGALIIALLGAVFYGDYALSAGWPKQGGTLPPGALIALLSIPMCVLAIQEMANLLQAEGVVISRRICTVAALLCMLWPWLQQVAEKGRNLPSGSWTHLTSVFDTTKPGYVAPTILAAALVAVFVRQSHNKKIEGAMANAGGSLLAIVYLGILPGFFFPIIVTHGVWMLCGILAMVKAADIGAYATGRLIGRHKLIPWLSPGKTIEGFIGGLLAAGGMGMLVAALRTGLVWQSGLMLGLVMGAVGQLGDLLESLLKRDAGVKDSGRLPGFGGLLDLLDSPLLAAPAAYWLLKIAIAPKGTA